MEDGPGAPVLETLTPILYRVSLLCYNKSHVPAVIQFTRTDEKGLGASAHELLKEISTKNPKVFSTHVKDLCKTLEGEAPTSTAPNPPGAVDDLKACAAFAKKFPKDIPMNTKDSRKLVQSFLNFALYGTPPQAAKHAITIIMNSDNKKELHAKELLAKSIKNFKYGGDHWLTKLSALSQLVLLAQAECEDDMDTVVEIAIQQVLQKPHTAGEEADTDWMDVPDEDIQGRVWAIKILVNRLRSLPTESILKDAAEDTYALLNRFIKQSGEGSDSDDTPAAHKTRQRLFAATSLLKLSCNKRLDSFLTPADFIQLALVTHDRCPQVRKGFADKLMRYLGQGRLPPRFYTILFLTAYEPEKAVKNSTMTWIRSRRAAFATRKETVLETVFARLLSALAHHPDFDREHETLKEMSEYILYYLKCVATEENLSLIFHVAQRVKSVADGIAPSTAADENLYVTSDLAQALIRSWEEQSNWTIQSYPGKMKLPSGIFRPLESHDQALRIAKKAWIGEDLVDDLDALVRKAIRSKKRKASDVVEKARKKVKGDRPIKENKARADRPMKMPKKKRRGGDDNGSELEDSVAPSSGPRRKSGRQSTTHKSYVEVSSDEEDAKAGAEEGNDEDRDNTEAEVSEESSPAPQDDVEMVEPQEAVADEPEAEAQEPDLSDAESLPEVKPPKQGKAGTKTKPGSITQKRKALEPAKENAPTRVARGSAKSKVAEKATEASSSSSPAVNGARRSGRTRG